MSKHFSCKDCCKYQTDACDNPKYAESGKHLCPFYVLDIEDCYQKGRKDAIEEYKSKLKDDVISRAKSISVTMPKDEQKAFEYATETFISALEYFAEQLKE